jgi:hypothetical protein
MAACSDKTGARQGQAGSALISVLVMLGILGIIGAALLTKSGNMTKYADKFSHVREVNGAFGYVQSLADCARIDVCSGAVALYPPEGDVPVLAVPSTKLAVGESGLTLRATCAKSGNKKRVAVELKEGSKWHEIGAISCD